PAMTTDATPVVLVADDEPSMLALVGQHIKTMGYEVLEASDGEQAWALAQEHLPDLVILDVMMPGMSGWEVCRKIREDVALAHTAIIMLTGIGENLNELTSPLYGADSYIDKPFAFPELDEKVRGALTIRQASRPGLARTAPADGLELVRNGNGGGHHDHPHGLLSPETETESDPPHAEAVDEAWSSDEDEGHEITNGADESIMLVDASSVTRMPSRRQHAGKPPSRGEKAARGAPRKPVKGRASSAAKSKSKSAKRVAAVKGKARPAALGAKRKAKPAVLAAKRKTSPTTNQKGPTAAKAKLAPKKKAGKSARLQAKSTPRRAPSAAKTLSVIAKKVVAKGKSALRAVTRGKSSKTASTKTQPKKKSRR
ncbi:MAG TPA: response regulator, partial [Polyangiaceae bacterium]|nr:response regulator [Polyangiaceae bacterium]